MNLLSRYSVLRSPDSGGSSGGAAPTSSPSGGESAPASAPSPSTSTPPSTEGGGDSDSSIASGSEQLDFSSIFGDGDSGDDGTSAFEPSPAKVTPKPPAAKAAEAPKAEPAPSEARPPTPAPTEATSAPPAQAAGTLDPYDPGAIAQVLMQNEAIAIQHVADTLFKLSNEEIEALENDTVSAIPKLLAKGMVKGQLNMLQQLSRLIPAMISKHGETMSRHASNESKFYSRWPDLKRDIHGPMVLKYGAVYRQMHPDATLETMIEDLGPMVMMAAKVQPGVASNGNHGAKPGPTKRGGPQPSPFIPAGAVGAGAIPQHAPELSAIESMFLSDSD